MIRKEIEFHGDTWTDPYHWLKEKSDPRVVAHLEEENRYTELRMKPSEALQETLYQEMIARIKQTDVSVPEKIDQYEYYSRMEEGKPYPIHCRKKEGEDREQIILDVNEIGKGKTYVSLGNYKVSPDHRLLAYSVDEKGNEAFVLHIKDLETGELLPDTISEISYGLEWAEDSRTFFYVTLDDSHRPYRLHRHTLGSNEDALVYEEKDKRFLLWITKTKDRHYLLLGITSKTSTEIHYLKRNQPTENFQVVCPREPDHKYFIEHREDKFFVLTNRDAKNFKVMEFPVGTLSKENWKEVISPRERIRIEEFDVFQDHLVIYKRENGLKKIEIVRFRDGNTHDIEFPEPVYSFQEGPNSNFAIRTLRFVYQSPATPPSVIDYDMESKHWEVKKQHEVVNYDPSLYECRRVWATSHDGTQIPISLVYKKEGNENTVRPLYLYGYGSYGISMDPIFSSHRISLLNRGFVYAVAHVRGGGEMGEQWREQGKFLQKKNTFLDFIACAEHLIALGYTSREKLVIHGRSAGGLLIGAVVNMRPDLFRAALADVPFVDVLNTMMDASLPLTVLEYEEWGNPNSLEYYRYIKSYAPYENVKAQEYPSMLITAGFNDPRVAYWEPAKWVAKLRSMKTDDRPILFKVNMGAGHRGYSSRYVEIRETAFSYAFILMVLENKL